MCQRILALTTTVTATRSWGLTALSLPVSAKLTSALTD